MKRAIATFVMLASSAVFAQVHGIPPSVTSYSSFSARSRFAPGIPASVTSLGPFGFSGPGSRKFTFGQPPHSRFHNGRGNGVGFGGGAAFIPYAYPVPVPVDNGYMPVDPNDPNAVAADPNGAPADLPAAAANDPRYGQHYLDGRENRQVIAAEPDPQPAPAVSVPVEKLMPVVIIFKDGHQQEIENYAIVGDTLYSFGGQLSHKIKLSDVDLKATQEKNDERGVDFHVPVNTPNT